MTVYKTIKFRRGSLTRWAQRNPVLAAGEPGYVMDTGKFKIGDGETAWNDLPYSGSGGGGGDGLSAYEVAVANGFVGDENDWLASLVGPPGPQGIQGIPGVAGNDGADGADGAPGAEGDSAYEVAVANGFVGDENAWLESLVGPQGPPGEGGSSEPGGYTTIVDIKPHTGATQAFTNLPAAQTELINQPYWRRLLDLTNATEMRLCINQWANASAGTQMKIQYSNDLSTWTDLGANVNLDTSSDLPSYVNGAWATIPSAAKIDPCYLRLVSVGGDGVADPSWYSIWIEIKGQGTPGPQGPAGADGVDGVDGAGGAVIEFRPNTGIVLSATNLPAAETELGNTTLYRKCVDLSNAQNIRISVLQFAVSNAGSKLKIQYSLNYSSWTDIGAEVALRSSGATASTEVGAWANIPIGAQEEICFLRAVTVDGDGVVDPSFYNVYGEIR